MATQTRTQRRTAAKKVGATRKRYASKQNSQRAKVSARRVARSAQKTGRPARTATKRAGGSATRRAGAKTTRRVGVARQAERGFLIPIGAFLEARDRVISTARTYTSPSAARRELNRFERRGATALRRNRRSVQRRANGVRRDIEHSANGLQSGTEDVLERIRSLV